MLVFKDDASLNLGLVMKPTNIPNVFALIGGGLLNAGKFSRHSKNHKSPSDTFGMNPDNAKDFWVGVEAARLYDDHELTLIHENALAVGGSVHKSVAPITHSSGRANGPRMPAGYASGDDFSVLNQFHLKQDLAAITTPHAPSDLFHQIGEQALKSVGLARDVTGRLTQDAQFSILNAHPEKVKNFGQSVAPSLGFVDIGLAFPLPIECGLAGASQHRPYMRKDALPSIAPIRLHWQRMELGQNANPRRHHGEIHDQPATRETAPPDTKAGSVQTQVKRALEALFNAQARMPPSGPIAFDPSLTPAWAGLKLPN